MLLKNQNLKQSYRLLFFLLAAITIAVVVSGVTHTSLHSAQHKVASSQTSQTNLQQTVPVAANAQCHVKGTLPDSTCTPGSADLRVTQDNIHQTICATGYTKTVRPSSSFTAKMKAISMQQYGFTDSASNYEYDHLISLELGGAPADTANLWPESGGVPNSKDTVENRLHSLVCGGSVSLSDAQRRIASNWTTALAGL